MNEILNLLENYDICKLDINRIYRYIEKYIKENASGTVDKDIEDEDEEDQDDDDEDDEEDQDEDKEEDEDDEDQDEEEDNSNNQNNRPPQPNYQQTHTYMFGNSNAYPNIRIFTNLQQGFGEFRNDINNLINTGIILIKL